MEELKLVRIANLHTHLREGAVVGPLIEKALEGGVCALGPMPNTSAGLTTASSVYEYILRARELVPTERQCALLPIVMVTEETSQEAMNMCLEDGIVDAKVYPRHRTTKSHNGVERYGRLLPILRYGGNLKMKFHFHPEHPSPIFGNRDAEFAFLPIARMFLEETDATIIWEHGTDARCIPHWKEMAKSGRFFVTLTAHHLAANEDETFGDVRAVCKPPIKTEEDRQGLIQLIAEGNRWVMAGADDAPHPIESKHIHEGRCACGAYTSPFLLLLYAHAFDGMLIRTESGTEILKNFLLYNALELHPQLRVKTESISVKRTPFTIPHSYDIGPWKVEPFWAGRTLNWSFA